MRLHCPIDSDHKRFSATAHVTQEWEVNEEGEFLASIQDCVVVTHRPNQHDLFLCMTCGAEARVES